MIQKLMPQWTIALCAIVLLSSLATGRAQGSVRAETEPKQAFGESKSIALPSPRPTQTETLAAPTNRLPDLILTGVAGLRSGHRAWLIVAESGQPSKVCVLRVGERAGDLELHEIDFHSGVVRVRYRDAEIALSFKTHSTLNESIRLLVQSRDYVEQVRPFVEEHIRGHELREQREKERRDRERVEVERPMAAPSLALPAKHPAPPE